LLQAEDHLLLVAQQEDSKRMAAVLGDVKDDTTAIRQDQAELLRLATMQARTCTFEEHGPPSLTEFMRRNDMLTGTTGRPVNRVGCVELMNAIMRDRKLCADQFVEPSDTDVFRRVEIMLSNRFDIDGDGWVFAHEADKAVGSDPFELGQ
jgi:hypothetical protein